MRFGNFPNAGAIYDRVAGNVVTAVNKTALGIVATKGITLYDWVQQPNKPTYSLAEINNVSGTYTGLTVGKANNADYATNAGYAVSSGKFCQHERFREQGHFTTIKEAGWIILSSHKYIDSGESLVLEQDCKPSRTVIRITRVWLSKSRPSRIM